MMTIVQQFMYSLVRSKRVILSLFFISFFFFFFTLILTLESVFYGISLQFEEHIKDILSIHI